MNINLRKDKRKERERDYKELAHMIMENGTFKLTVGHQAQDPEEPIMEMKSRGICWRLPSYLGEGTSFCSFKPSIDWIRPAYIMEGNLFYSIY